MQNFNQNINPSEDFFCLEDYEDLNNVQSVTRHAVMIIKNNQERDPTKDIYIIYSFNGKFNRKLHNRDDLKNFYSFIRIYNANHYINIIIYEKDKNDGNKILNKINNSNLKGLFKNLLKINHFSDFILIEHNKTNHLFDKIYVLYYKANNNNMNKINKNFKNNNVIQPNLNKEMNNNNNFKNNMKISTSQMYSMVINNISKEKFKPLFIEGNDSFFPIKGLRNVGLTCYMNSTLQCLLHVTELNNFFINIYYEEKDNFKCINKNAETKGQISDEYYNLVKIMCNIGNNEKKSMLNFNFFGINFSGLLFNDDNSSYSPYKFNELISKLNTQFAQYESNDSKDLLLYLFQSMHEELNYLGKNKLNVIPKCNQLKEESSFKFFFQVNSCLNFSIISYLFYGILKSCTICSICNNILYNFQYFQFLSFPLYNYDRKDFNLYMGLKDYIKEEILSGDNQCYCQNCKILTNARTCSIIYYTPPYLLINLDYGKNKKYRPNRIFFGEMIDLTGFVQQGFEEKTYELIAVSTHIGESGNSGHYIAYCKDKNKVWHKFNDSYHKTCQLDEIRSNSPYLLLYKKVNT